MITMALIYIAGIVSGVLLVAIGIAGWVRNAGKKLGGETYQTPHGIAGAHAATDASATPVARNRANNVRGGGRHFARTT